MAQGFAILANLGKPVSIRALVNEEPASARLQDEKKSVSIKPGIIFLVNYLMKGSESVELKNGSQDKVWTQPSCFRSEDDEGSWVICYTNDALAC